MEITTTTVNRTPGRRAAVNTLALIGFIALIIIGIGLAIYSARYMPKFASKINGAAVSLSSIFHRTPDAPALQVVTATSTLPFGSDSSAAAATSTATSTDTQKPSTTSTGSKGTSGTSGSATYTTVTTTTTITPYGQPDLSVKVTDVGYLTRKGDTSSFVGSNTVPFSNNGAVKFTVTNTGTNVTGNWNFSVDIPTSPSQHFTAPDQSSLNPGDSVDFILGFDRGYSSGQQITVTVTADPSNRINETTKNNNVSSRWVIVQ